MTARPVCLMVILLSCVGLLAPAVRASDTATAEYKVQFDATWSVQTHPLNFPSNAHFSPLIGGTHNSSVHFWTVGELASQGIQDMAERGRTTPLDLEVQAAIDAATAQFIVTGGGIGPSPGSVSTTFTISQDFPLVTLVSMIAPTPDWFVGVNGLQLFSNGAWLVETTVSLLPYDAGTDSGPDYTSPNQATMPHQPITLNSAPHFANGTPLGTFTFTRIDMPVSGADDFLPGEGLSRAIGWPNPFRAGTGVRFGLARPDEVTVSVFDARGRIVSVLHSGRLGGGSHYVPWAGTDRHGAPAQSGVYFIRVRSSNQTRDAKVVRLR